MKINTKKSEVLYQLNSTRTREEDIMVDGNKLNSVVEFIYLGSTISSNGCIDDEIQRRMAKASTSFDRLRQRVWNNHPVSMRVKGKIYRAIVLSTLLYGGEAWTVYIRQVKKLMHVSALISNIMTPLFFLDNVYKKGLTQKTNDNIMTFLFSYNPDISFREQGLKILEKSVNCLYYILVYILDKYICSNRVHLTFSEYLR